MGTRLVPDHTEQKSRAVCIPRMYCIYFWGHTLVFKIILRYAMRH